MLSTLKVAEIFLIKSLKYNPYLTFQYKKLEKMLENLQEEYFKKNKKYFFKLNRKALEKKYGCYNREEYPIVVVRRDDDIVNNYVDEETMVKIELAIEKVVEDYNKRFF